MRGLLAGVAPTGRGKWNAELYDQRDVETIGRRLRLGHYGKESRRVIVVGSGLTLDPQALALAAAGLTVERVDSVLEGLGAHSELGMPILVVPAASMGSHEWSVLGTVIERVYCILIGSEGEAPEVARRRAVLMDHDELRKLVSHAWALVETRIDQVNLRL